MTYSVDNRLELTLFFDEVEFPVEHLNTVDALIVESMIGTILPTFFVKVTDSIDILQSRNLVRDGSKVSVVIKGPGEQKPRTMNFRVFKSKNQTTQLGSQWMIDGYLDFPKYWLQTTNVGIRSTSSDLLAKIATTCGLKIDIDNTSDSQLWMPQNKTYGEWVRSLTSYGYANDNSLMLQGVDLDGRLHYKDFNRGSQATGTLVYGRYEQGQIPILDYAPAVQSGLTNRITGYNMAMHQQSTTRTNQQYKELTWRPDSRTPLFDSNLKATGRRGYQQFGLLDFGNVHPASERAFYQNKRYANFYNLSVEFMTNVASGINIFDMVNFIPKAGTDEDDNSYAGTYKVSAYQMRIEAMTYTEYLCGERHGLNK